MLRAVGDSPGCTALTTVLDLDEQIYDYVDPRTLMKGPLHCSNHHLLVLELHTLASHSRGFHLHCRPHHSPGFLLLLLLQIGDQLRACWHFGYGQDFLRPRLAAAAPAGTARSNTAPAPGPPRPAPCSIVDRRQGRCVVHDPRPLLRERKSKSGAFRFSRNNDNVNSVSCVFLTFRHYLERHFTSQMSKCAFSIMGTLAGLWPWSRARVAHSVRL